MAVEPTPEPLVERVVPMRRRHVRAVLRIEQQVFGPVQANDEGTGTVRVVVPPGVRYAYHGEKPIDLQLPAVPRHHVVLDALRIPADAPADVGIRVYAVTPTGAPLYAANLATCALTRVQG